MHINSSGLQWLQLPFLWDWIFKMYLLNHSMNGLSFFLSMSWSLSLWASLRDGDYKWMCAACVMPINEESLRPVWTLREERAVVPSPYISILNSLESPPLSVALPQTLIGRLTHFWANLARSATFPAFPRMLVLRNVSGAQDVSRFVARWSCSAVRLNGPITFTLAKNNSNDNYLKIASVIEFQQA